MIKSMANESSKAIEILDESFEVIASTDIENCGKVRDVNLESVSDSEIVYKDGFSYKSFGSKIFGQYVLGIEGMEEETQKLIKLICVPFNSVSKFYGAKHSKTEFIKNIILDNVLPGDISVRSLELKISTNVNRICMIFKCISKHDAVLYSVIRSMFPDGSKDFVIVLSENEVVVIKELSNDFSELDFEKIALSVISSLATECYIKCIAGFGTVVNKVSELGDSFRAAQVALEVRKIFENEKSIAIYSQLGVARLIYQLPISLCKVFLKEVFKKCSIESIDREIMFTIYKFFENSLNVSETARKLFVHRNTLVYRIEKIKRMTGLDLRNFEDAIVFKIALMVHRYLKENTKEI
jgi:carbohydrate diacid regulator